MVVNMSITAHTLSLSLSPSESVSMSPNIYIYIIIIIIIRYSYAVFIMKMFIYIFIESEREKSIEYCKNAKTKITTLPKYRLSFGIISTELQFSGSFQQSIFKRVKYTGTMIILWRIRIKTRNVMQNSRKKACLNSLKESSKTKNKERMKKKPCIPLKIVKKYFDSHRNWGIMSTIESPNTNARIKLFKMSKRTLFKYDFNISTRLGLFHVWRLRICVHCRFIFKEKATWEQYKNATRYYEQILEAACHETTVVWPLTSHLKNHPSRRHVGQCWSSKDKLIKDILLWTLIHGLVRVSWPRRIHLRQLCADTGCSLEDLPRARDDRDGGWERIREIRAVSATWRWWWFCVGVLKRVFAQNYMISPILILYK